MDAPRGNLPSRRPGAVAIAEIVVAGEPGPWEEVGFDCHERRITAGTVAIRLAGPVGGRGIVGWSLYGHGGDDLDGLPTARSAYPPPVAAAPPHPNGALRIDHVVAFSPSLDRTDAALQAAGLTLRRRREGPTPAGAVRQSFFRLGETILEVVEHPPGTPAAADLDAPARLWGLAFAVDDLDRTARTLGPLLGAVRPAVQAGRRIATVRREAGLTVPVAFITIGA